MTHPPPLPDDGITSGAGFWIRALARVIDMAFGMLLGLIGGILGVFVLVILQIAGRVSPGWEQHIQGVGAAGFGLSLLGGFLYHSFCEGIHGASLGKLICRLRVLRYDGGPSNMKGALIRSLGMYVDALFFGLIGYSSMQKSSLKQRYGDVWGKTIVIKTRDLPTGHPRSPLRFLLGFFLGITCWTLLLALSLITSVPIKTPLPLIDKAAADINLQISDLDASFILEAEDKQDVFIDTIIKDGNQRLFTSQNDLFYSMVLVFRIYPSNTISELRAEVEEKLRREFEGQILVFDPAQDITLGDRGSIQKFSIKSAGTDGCVLFFIKQNVFVRLIVYGLPEMIRVDEIQALASIIEDRIR